jgi:hypothetical protein
VDADAAGYRDRPRDHAPEVTGRVRNFIEAHAVISLAGRETERHWCAWLTDAPDDWQDQVQRMRHMT